MPVAAGMETEQNDVNVTLYTRQRQANRRHQPTPALPRTVFICLYFLQNCFGNSVTSNCSVKFTCSVILMKKMIQNCSVKFPCSVTFNESSNYRKLGYSFHSFSVKFTVISCILGLHLKTFFFCIQVAVVKLALAYKSK